MKYSKALAAGTALLSAAALAADTVQLKPGRWLETVKVTTASLDGKPLPTEPFQDERYACVSPQAASDPANTFLAVSNSGECSAPDGTASGGRIAVSTTCVSEKLKLTARMAFDGHYSPDAYRMTAKTTAQMSGKALLVDGTIEGRFIGPCTGDETLQR